MSNPPSQTLPAGVPPSDRDSSRLRGAAAARPSGRWLPRDEQQPFILAELASVDIEYRLADSEDHRHASSGGLCPNCRVPLLFAAELCIECGYYTAALESPARRARLAAPERQSAWRRCLGWFDRCLAGASPKKRMLCVRDRSFDDADLARLKRLHRYRLLDFEGANLTDAALVHLERLRKLELLVLRGTRLTPCGVQRLREKLPRCEIIV